MFPEDIDIKEREELAATRIQAAARTRLARKAHKKPLTPHPTNYGILPWGNEPYIEIPKDKKQASGKFVFVGCAGLQNLEIIKSIIDWEKYDFTEFNQNEMANIPKLFILDYSVRVYHFWRFMKFTIMKANSLEHFQAQFKSASKKFLSNKIIKELLVQHVSFFRNPYKWFKKWAYFYQLRDMPGFISHLCDRDEKKFHVFKNIILSSTLLLENFSSKQAFDFIAQHTLSDRSEQPLYFFASNVLELTSKIERHSSGPINNEIIENIDALHPTLIMHGRTLGSIETNACPNKHLMIYSDIYRSKNDHRELLRDSNKNCIPIIGLENGDSPEQKEHYFKHLRRN